MKNNILFRILFVLAFAVIAANTVTATIQSLFPSISNLPQGEFMQSSISPEGNSRVDFYIIKNSMGVAIRGERVRGDEHDNIYWQTNIDSVNVEWLDEKGIIINSIPLNIETDKFDSRKGTSIFSDGVLAYKITNND